MGEKSRFFFTHWEVVHHDNDLTAFLVLDHCKPFSEYQGTQVAKWYKYLLLITDNEEMPINMQINFFVK